MRENNLKNEKVLNNHKIEIENFEKIKDKEIEELK